jgi:hypothetical protein
VNGTGVVTILTTHIFTGTSYDPAERGAINAIDYREYGIILSFPVPDAFSTTQSALMQGGRVFRSTPFARFIAANSTHEWETKSLSPLDATDYVAVDGSGDHPDFSINGDPIYFGFTRTNARSSTQPPVPSDWDLVINQGVDHLMIFAHRQPEIDDNDPLQAKDDTFILNGYKRSLPLLEIFDVVRNDSDPDGDTLEITEVTEPIYGSAGNLSAHTIVYQLAEAQVYDTFSYTISDGEFTSTADVSVHIDCACTVLCLNSLELPEGPLPQQDDGIDLPLIYRVRDQVLKPTLDGRRYIDMYYRSNPEILVNILMNEQLRVEALETVVLWQDSLRNLTDGDGSVTISQEEMDALENFLNSLSALSSDELQGLIAEELQRLGPLDDYVGMTMKAAKSQAIGDRTLHFPRIHAQQ